MEPKADAKLNALEALLDQRLPVAEGIVFSQFADNS
jgi:hypothetical protein